MIFHGQRFEEELFDALSVPAIEVDLGVFVVGWESRSSSFIESGKITGKRCLLFSFENDGITEERREKFYDIASKGFDSVESIELPNARSRVRWESEIQKLFKSSENIRGLSCFVDYTSLPKAVTQTLYRFLLVDQSFCRSHWGYLEGVYPENILGKEYSQGLAEPFFPIRHTPGTGGVSEKQALIVSIGADEHVIFELLETRSYDAVAVMYSDSNLSPALEEGRKATVARLCREYSVADELILQSSASSVNDAINNYIALIKRIPKEYSVDIFCCGTKSHAVAACAVAERFKKTVALLGRVPNRYTQNDVKPSGRGSVSSMTDFTNPNVSKLLIGKT